MKDRIDIFHESIDLLVNYGATSQLFIQPINKWLTYALQDVLTLGLLEWRVWKIYADWGYAGQHLEQGIQDKPLSWFITAQAK